MGNEFPIVCDPDQISREPYPIFNAFIIDRKGVIRTRVPGTKAARPSLESILQALAKVEGVPIPEWKKPDKSESGQTARAGASANIPADRVLDVLWMWSHDRIAAGDEFKLAFLPTLAEGFHVYAPTEEKMSPFKVEFKLPKGIELAKPLQFPKPIVKSDPILEMKVKQYEKDVPMQAIELRATKELTPSEIVVTADVHYQACNDALCFPPTIKSVTMPVTVVAPEEERNQVAGWKSW